MDRCPRGEHEPHWRQIGTNEVPLDFLCDGQIPETPQPMSADECVETFRERMRKRGWPDEYVEKMLQSRLPPTTPQALVFYEICWRADMQALREYETDQESGEDVDAEAFRAKWLKRGLTPEELDRLMSVPPPPRAAEKIAFLNRWVKESQGVLLDRDLPLWLQDACRGLGKDTP